MLKYWKLYGSINIQNLQAIYIYIKNVINIYSHNNSLFFMFYLTFKLNAQKKKDQHFVYQTL